jgi:ParB/RepB/Spo0J family partition protein
MEQEKREPKLEQVPIDKLTVDPMNVRITIGDVSDLIDSISRVGLLNPLVVRPLSNGKYGVICGSRRLYALRALGWKEVPCRVVNYNDKNALVTSFTENITQKTLSEQEKIAVYRKAKEVAGSYRAAARLLGVSPEEVRKSLLLAGIEDDDIEIVDGRKKPPEKKNGNNGEGQAASEKTENSEKKQVPKKIAREAMRVLKKFSEMAKRESADTGPHEGQPQPQYTGQQPAKEQPSLRQLADKLDWKPRVFRSYRESRPLHEVLASPEARVAIPDKDMAKIAHEWARVGEPVSMLVPVTPLDPPFQHVKVLLCPNCLAPLRGVAQGAAVVCFECGFPNQDVWRPA